MTYKAPRRNKNMAAKKALSFEKAIERLETIADTLENGNTALKDALALYEEGAALLKQCAAELDEAQAKITVLSKDGKAADGE